MARRFTVVGAPFDGGSTLGTPGSRYAPAAIRRNLSWIMQRVQDGFVYALDTRRNLPFSPDALDDCGDADVVAHDIGETVDAVSRSVSEIVHDGRVPIVLGGDDSLFFPSVRGFHDAVEGRVGVIHFDAHLDLLDHSRNQGHLSQSSGMRRVLELDRVDAENCIQVGSRHFNFPSSGAFKAEHALAHITVGEFEERGARAVADEILERLHGADHIFLSFDIDAIDPAFAPGCGAHEPGGITSRQALDVIRFLAPHLDGLAITEVNPLVDVDETTSVLAAYLMTYFAVFGAVTASEH